MERFHESCMSHGGREGGRCGGGGRRRGGRGVGGGVGGGVYGGGESGSAIPWGALCYSAVVRVGGVKNGSRGGPLVPGPSEKKPNAATEVLFSGGRLSQTGQLNGRVALLSVDGAMRGASGACWRRASDSLNNNEGAEEKSDRSSPKESKNTAFSRGKQSMEGSGALDHFLGQQHLTLHFGDVWHDTEEHAKLHLGAPTQPNAPHELLAKRMFSQKQMFFRQLCHGGSALADPGSDSDPGAPKAAPALTPLPSDSDSRQAAILTAAGASPRSPSSSALPSGVATQPGVLRFPKTEVFPRVEGWQIPPHIALSGSPQAYHDGLYVSVFEEVGDGSAGSPQGGGSTTVGLTSAAAAALPEELCTQVVHKYLKHAELCQADFPLVGVLSFLVCQAEFPFPPGLLVPGPSLSRRTRTRSTT